MKEKLKKYFNKDKIFIWICTILIVLFVAMSVIFLKKDVEDNKNKHSEISLCDTYENLYTSYAVDSNGNLLTDNYVNNDRNAFIDVPNFGLTSNIFTLTPLNIYLY